MIVSRWKRFDDEAEVIVSSPLDDRGFRAWNLTRGRFAVEGLYATVEDIEEALADAGWTRVEGNSP